MNTPRVTTTPDTSNRAKPRDPVGVFGLALLTLGVYYPIWYYKINRELRDFNRATGRDGGRELSPAISVLAITIGWLIVFPPFVSYYRTLRRIEAAQAMRGTREPVRVGMGFVLFLVGALTLPFEMIYTQSTLNRLWSLTRD